MRAGGFTRSAGPALLLAITLLGLGPAGAATQGMGPDMAPWSSPALSHIPLPEWLSLSGEVRMRMERRNGLGYVSGASDGYGLLRTRVNVEVHPDSRLQFFVQGQDARAPGILPGRANGVYRDPFDLRQAYVRVGGPDDRAAVTVGRQLLLYGDQRLIGPLDWTNTSRSFDAVKLELRVRGLQLDVLSSRVVQNDPTRSLNRSSSRNALHGLYATVRPGPAWLAVESFVLWRSLDGISEDGDTDRYSAGARAVTRSGGLESAVMYVEQWGRSGPLEIGARAVSASAAYRFEAPATPRVYAEMNYATGDSDPTDGNLGSFDDMFPTAHLYYGYTDLVGFKNIRNIRVGVAASPLRSLGVALDFHTFALDSPRDGLYNVAGVLTVAAPDGGAPSRRVGEEVDLTFNLRLGQTVSLAGGVGRLFPGPFLTATTQGAASTFTYTALSVRF